MRFALFIAATLLVLARLAGAAPLAVQQTIDREVAAIQNDFNVQVHCAYDRDRFFPGAWLSPDVDATGRQMEPEETARVLPLIRTFLSSHPLSVIHADLHDIYLLGGLVCCGKEYGSTYADKGIYLVSKGEAQRYTDEFIVQRLHSEFSSILLRHHRFPSEQWQQINSDGFRYSGSGYELLDNPSRYDCTEQSCAEGFLLTYSTSSMENDFNMISSWLFTKRAELDAVARKYAKIQSKQRLAEQFYLSLSSQYTFD